jgi:hypothetical protein
MTLKAKTFKELNALKELNLHTEAYQAAAMALGLAELAARFGAIFREQERGSLTAALYSRRRTAYEELMTRAKRLLSAEQYDRLYMCF